MTATDPRPRLAPAAEALAAAYAQDMGAQQPPPDDRARAECHRTGRARLAHLRELLAVLDWSAAHMPGPEPAPEPEEEPWEPPPLAVSDHDGGEDEFHYCGEAWVGSQETPGFEAWLEDPERRVGPVPLDGSRAARRTPSPAVSTAQEAGPRGRQAMTATPPHDKT